ncbi:hypothetical protein B0H17DRAFT_1268308 [Mycena rosella]|nr:hypothetical protein B0H17DRAFT_1268308 [Mycena rosella]
MYHDDGDIDLVRDPGPFPVLQTLTLIGVDEEEYDYSPGATLDMLSICPNVVECALNGARYLDDHSLDYIEMLALPHVRDLEFGRYLHSTSGERILPYLTLPALQSLVISWKYIDVQDLLRLLQRSAPPLHQIITDSADLMFPGWTLEALNWGHRTRGVDKATAASGASRSLFQQEEMKKCLALLPALTRFDFQPRRDSDAAVHFLAILTGSPHSLPLLSTFTLFVLSLFYTLGIVQAQNFAYRDETAAKRKFRGHVCHRHLGSQR